MTGILNEGLDGNASSDTLSGTSNIDKAATSEVSAGMQERVNLVIAAKPGVELQPEYAARVRTNLDLFAAGRAPEWTFVPEVGGSTIGVMYVPKGQEDFATGMIQVWGGVAIVK